VGPIVSSSAARASLKSSAGLRSWSMGCGRNKLEVPSPNDWVGGRYNTASVFPRQVRGRVRDKVLDYYGSKCMYGSEESAR
jgi:hypothetical protein